MYQTLLSREDAAKLARRTAVFRGIDDAGNMHTFEWQRKADGAVTNPTPTPNGVSGFCILDGAPMRRIHVCAHAPCLARHLNRDGNVQVCKYGAIGPPDHHLRLVYTSDYPPLSDLPAPSSPIPASSHETRIIAGAQIQDIMGDRLEGHGTEPKCVPELRAQEAQQMAGHEISNRSRHLNTCRPNPRA